MVLLVVVLVVIALAALLLGGAFVLGERWRSGHEPGPKAVRPDAVRRILLPFTGSSISRRAFDAAVRLARMEGATLMPCYLATVPLNLPLDAPLPRQCAVSMTLLEVIEQRAASQGIAIDARVSRGRTFRDALRRELEEEPFDRVIVSAESHRGAGFSGDDLVWLLDRADAEVLILRPAPEDAREVSAQAASVPGHF